ncbi:MAG: hypothetical protein ACO31I_14770 [Prochlorotrichaceae cyanobacterium]|jgi:arylamine N-acetyltransferase
MKKRDKWVIDADIARSSGTTEHPVSKSCREFLDFIRDQGYFVVMNAALSSEWNQHHSIYAKRWLASMYARKQVIRHEDGGFNFEQKIISSSLSDVQKDAALKDMHLLNASRNHGKTIASGDNTAREIYVVLAISYREIADFFWVNPKNESQMLIEYISNSKSSKAEWYLSKGYHDR